MFILRIGTVVDFMVPYSKFSTMHSYYSVYPVYNLFYYREEHEECEGNRQSDSSNQVIACAIVVIKRLKSIQQYLQVLHGEINDIFLNQHPIQQPKYIEQLQSMCQIIIEQFISFWVVIDPIGSVPVFIAVTRGLSAEQRRNTAFRAIFYASLILLFFLGAGQLLLDALQIPLLSFQIAGGIILFLFALTMIFGDSKPEQEEQLEIEAGLDCAVFPLAMPSIASPGAMLVAVVLTDNHRFDVYNQMITASVMLTVLVITLILLLFSTAILRLIGKAGASIVSRVMGLILATVATEHVLSALKLYFQSV